MEKTEKQIRKAEYNRKHREKQKEKQQEQATRTPCENIKVEKVYESTDEPVTISEFEKSEEEEPPSNIITLDVETYNFLMNQARKGIALEKEKNKKVSFEEPKPESQPEQPKPKPNEESFFFQLTNGMKRHMISSIASAGSVLALSLLIRGTTYCMNSTNKFPSITTSNQSKQQQEIQSNTYDIRTVSIG